MPMKVSLRTALAPSNSFLHIFATSDTKRQYFIRYQGYGPLGSLATRRTRLCSQVHRLLRTIEAILLVFTAVGPPLDRAVGGAAAVALGKLWEVVR